MIYAEVALKLLINHILIFYKLEMSLFHPKL